MQRGSKQSHGNKVFPQRKYFWVTWLFALFWNAFVWVTIFLAGDKLLDSFEQNPVFYFFVTFPFIGLWLVLLAIKETLAGLKLGTKALVLDPFPGQVGGYVKGYLDLPVSVEVANRARVSLACIHHYYERKRAGDNDWEVEPIWQDYARKEICNFGKMVRLNFTFMPPEGLPVNGGETEDYYEWELHIQIPLSGVDFDQVFFIPVEVADERTITKLADYKSTASHVIADKENKSGAIPVITKTPVGIQFYYGYGRSVTLAILLCCIGGGLGIFSYFFFDDFITFLPTTARLMAFLTGFIALILCAFGVFLATNNLTVEVGLTGVKKRQRIFGITLEKIIYVNNIADIEVKKNASSKSGNTTRVWYQLDLITCDAKRIGVGDSLEGYGYANEIKQKMILALGNNWRPGIFHEQIEKKPQPPFPSWVRVAGKLFSGSFFFAFLYDVSAKFPQIKIFLAKMISLISDGS